MDDRSAIALRVIAPQDPLLARLGDLIADAYPVLGIRDADALANYVERMRLRARDPETRVVAAERAGDLAGGMFLYDYRMNVRGRDALTGGVGGVAVGLTHKRRGVARALIRWYLDDYRAKSATFAALYPFRPDFYRSMGFGYGTPTQRYRFAPDALRDEGARGTARLLGAGDADAVVACYERVRKNSNGLIAKHLPALRRTLADRAFRHVGIVDDDGTLRAFMQTNVVTAPEGVANRNVLAVRDVTYEDEAALAALLGYLRAQRDQFAEVAIESQDDAFHLVSRDPRDGSDIQIAPPAVHRVAERGLGIMYRILDVPRAFSHLAPVETPFALRVEVEDPFFPATAGTWTFRFGRYAGPQQDEDVHPDATLRIGIADLSSLVVGSVDLRALVRHRLATIEPYALLDRADRAFRPELRPVCTTRF